MRDQELTGAWAGFSFKRGKLISPERHEFGPEDLAWLSLTVGIAREWRLMMQEHRAGQSFQSSGKVVHFRDGVRQRYAKKRACTVDDSGPGPGLQANVRRALGLDRS